MLNPIIKPNLSNSEYSQYARQIIIKEINSQGQIRLKQAKILCIGAGGLSSPILLYLTSCGIGTIGIIDYDKIDLSNLQRQIIYKQNQINQYKTIAAFNALKNLNPKTIIHTYNQYLSTRNIEQIIIKYDIVIDGIDNFETRYTISQYCYLLHKIHIYGAIEKFEGQVSVFNYQSGPHYYNLYNKISQVKLKNCNESGVFNTVTSFIGTFQATETIKIILGIGSIINHYLLVFNLLEYSLNRIKIKQNRIIEQIVIQSRSAPQNNYISIKDLINNSNKSLLLIDLRTKIEFLNRHIEKAVNIPLNNLKKKRIITDLIEKKEKTLVIYCDDESRSYLGSRILQKHKLEHFILKGGLNNIRKERDSNPR